MSGIIKSSITAEGVVTSLVRAVGQCTLQIVTTKIRFAPRTQIWATRHRRADESVCPNIGHFDTLLHGFNCEQIFSTSFSILDAQHVVARQYSFSSWRRLKCFVYLTREGENSSDPSLAKMVRNHNKIMMAAQ